MTPEPSSHAAAERRVRDWLAAGPPALRAAEFVAETYRAPRVFLLGGTVRDVLLGSVGAGDVDLVIAGVPRADYDAVAGRVELQRTYFGAHSLRHAGATVDVIRIEEMVNIVHYRLAPTMPNVVATVPLNLDAIAYDVTDGALYDGGCLAGLADRTVRFRACTPPREPINAVRCLRLRERLGFSFDANTTALIVRAARAVRARPAVGDDVRLFLARHDVAAPAIEALLRELDGFAD